MIGCIAGVACGPRQGEERRGSVRIERAEVLAARPLSDGERKTADAVRFAILGSGSVRSFHGAYSALFRAHQPVYVTADALLHAWHASYDDIMFAVERNGLAPLLDRMLGELRGALQRSLGPAQVRADVDVYLAVAYSLLHGKLAPPVAGGERAVIAAIVEQATRATGTELTLFGTKAMFDFSMLRPRGRYEDSGLDGYFRAMSWLGRVELRIASRKRPSEPWQLNQRALDGAMLLAMLFDGPSRSAWDAFDQVLGSIVGPRDSMSLPELAAASAALPADRKRVPVAEIVAAFREPAAQRIRTQLVLDGEQSLAFVLLGQRYTFDAHVMSNLVEGAIDTRPPRMMPSPLDIGYAVFGNAVAKRLLARELGTYGAPYAAALEAARRDADASAGSQWAGSLHHLWLGALRALSPDPAGDAALPAPLQSDAWSRRMLNTQLASWAELRHDNVLYAKPSASGGATCEYPDGYIDPYPAFYGALEAIAARGKAAVLALALEEPGGRQLAAYFDAMSATMARLRQIAERERANQPLDADDLDFLNHMVSFDGKQVGCTTVQEPAGWYGELFFDRMRAKEHEPVIADVHTAALDDGGDLHGNVLHVATAMPRMMVVTLAHDGGQHAQTYRGVVSTYSEVVTGNFHRMTDDEWDAELARRPPVMPEWLGDIVAP